MLYTTYVSGSDYKILVLPSGGATGIIPATILACLERDTGKAIHQLFDEIWASSIGSMIASLLTVPNLHSPTSSLMTAEEVTDFLENSFASLKTALTIRKRFRRYVSPKIQLRDTLIPVRVVAAEVTQSHPFYKGWPAQTEIKCFSGIVDGEVSLADIVCGSCTVFPFHSRAEKVRLNGGKMSLVIDAGAKVCSEPCMNPLFPLLRDFLKKDELLREKISIYFLSNGWVRLPTPSTQEGLAKVKLYNFDVDLELVFQKWKAETLQGQALSMLRKPIFMNNLAGAGFIPLKYFKEQAENRVSLKISDNNSSVYLDILESLRR